MIALAFSLVTTLALPADRITDTSGRPVFIASLPCSNRLQATSSGFVMTDETVVTVAHALFESRDFAVRDAAGNWHEATVRYMDLERDLAVLAVPGLRADDMTTGRASAGTAVRVVDGSASGTIEGEVLRPVRISTEIIGDTSQQSERSGYELSTPVIGGDSGAAVVDDDDNLIGVIFARSTRREAAWATSVSEIDAVLGLEGVPSWECEPDPEARLDLLPVREPARLAG